MKNPGNQQIGRCLLLQLSLFSIYVPPGFADATVVLDKLVVEGAAVPGNGLITPQNSARATSVITRPAIEQKNPQNNIYQE